MTVFIVAVEYRGTDLQPHTAERRTGIREHAYDVDTETVVDHRPPAMAPRLGFPNPQRAWNSAPQLARCADCAETVTRTVVAIITAALRVGAE
jgi:hypothetical protein